MTSPGNETAWTVAGADGQPILGDAHVPGGAPRGVVLIAHGFKGYKDYGMFPRIARTLAGRGFIAHRFNFSHSGMTNNIETFERPDLFERDTWNRQVTDLRAVMDAVASGTIAGRDVPLVLFGHSRGGVTALLTAGRMADDHSARQPAGVVTAAAPATCNTMSEDEQRELLDKGFIVTQSSRTGQDLRIDKQYLQEQLDDPEAHDLLELVKKIRRPMLFVHGDDDPTVPAEHADQLGRAAGDRGDVLHVPGADHVFNTPNPLPEDQDSSPQLQQLMDALSDFAARVCSTAHSS